MNLVSYLKKGINKITDSFLFDVLESFINFLLRFAILFLNPYGWTYIVYTWWVKEIPLKTIVFMGMDGYYYV